ncbi:MAG: aspartate kinase [Eubacteriales bacterium]|nr:aspartate kinase [Eubacteriales bacterium]
MIKITKFGGSSVANSEQFKKVKSIIEADEARRFVVISAAGKAGEDKNKITDLLYLCNAHVEYHVDYMNIFNMIKERFFKIKSDLGLSTDIEGELDELGKNLPKLSVDELVSRGEYFTSKLMADFLGFAFVDAKDVIRFNYDGTIDFELTEKELEVAMLKYERFVIPGFYGVLPDGQIKVMSRGGSDITGSILAKCLKADIYENWTDVSGFMMADPRIIENPRQIDKITYAELRELSYMGASVLHEDAVFPVKEANIPINVLNTNKPDDKGTIILDSIEPSEKDPRVTGIAGRKGFSSFTIYKKHMSDDATFLQKLLNVFVKYGVTVEHMPSGIDSVSLVVKEKDVANRYYDIIESIRKEVKPDNVKYEAGISIIACVGRNMATRPGTSGKLFTALGADKVNVKVIIQAFDEINILVGVATEDFERAIRAIYNSFNH